MAEDATIVVGAKSCGTRIGCNLAGGFASVGRRPLVRGLHRVEGRMTMDRRGESAFTLIELMIVVIILGVLAAIAVPSFLEAFQTSKTSEVHALLRDIAAKQEAYKAEFGQYLNVSQTMDFGNRRPAIAPRNDFGWVDWDGGSDVIGLGWRQLGFRPQSAVRFGYVVVAGMPGVVVAGVPAGLADTTTHWWAAVGYGNASTAPIGGVGDCSQYYLSSSQNILGVVNEGQ
jgi:prepilin-type N-terminal cleavage/methylation domain-containing protein